MKFLFEMGDLVSTPAALAAIVEAGQEPVDFIRRHGIGDFGEVDAGDADLNRAAIRHGSRILSAYTLASGRKLWIITEADRSTTTLLLPEEY